MGATSGTGTVYASETTEFIPWFEWSLCCSIYHKILNSKYKIKIPDMYSQNKTWAWQRGHEKPQCKKGYGDGT
jgi:hypothetical protein